LGLSLPEDNIYNVGDYGEEANTSDMDDCLSNNLGNKPNKPEPKSSIQSEITAMQKIIEEQ